MDRRVLWVSLLAGSSMVCALGWVLAAELTDPPRRPEAVVDLPSPPTDTRSPAVSSPLDHRPVIVPDVLRRYPIDLLVSVDLRRVSPDLLRNRLATMIGNGATAFEPQIEWWARLRSALVREQAERYTLMRIATLHDGDEVDHIWVSVVAGPDTSSDKDAGTAELHPGPVLVRAKQDGYVYTVRGPAGFESKAGHHHGAVPDAYDDAGQTYFFCMARTVTGLRALVGDRDLDSMPMLQGWLQSISNCRWITVRWTSEADATLGIDLVLLPRDGKRATIAQTITTDAPARLPTAMDRLREEGRLSLAQPRGAMVDGLIEATLAIIARSPVPDANQGETMRIRVRQDQLADILGLWAVYASTLDESTASPPAGIR